MDKEPEAQRVSNLAKYSSVHFKAETQTQVCGPLASAPDHRSLMCALLSPELPEKGSVQGAVAVRRRKTLAWDGSESPLGRWLRPEPSALV